MSGPHKHEPVRNPSGIVPTHCRQCGAPSTGAWPLSKWTLTGFSPWCPKCHALHAPHKAKRARPGPKPKAAVKGGWTNMPIN